MKHIITMTIEQGDYECDDYGMPECATRSLRIPMMRVVKALRDCRLPEAKRVADLQGAEQAQGRVVLRLAASDAGVGRLFLLCRENDEYTARFDRGELPETMKHRPTQYRIDNVETFYDSIIAEVGA